MVHFFLQQTALCCITSWYLPSGPVTLTSQALMNKRHFSSEFVLPPMPVFSMDLKHIIISWGILQIGPSRCQDILQTEHVEMNLEDLAFLQHTGNTNGLAPFLLPSYLQSSCSLLVVIKIYFYGCTLHPDPDLLFDIASSFFSFINQLATGFPLESH